MSELDDALPSGRPERGAILSFEVTGPEGAAVVVAVDHRDPDGVWSPAGSVAMVAPTQASLRIQALKAERRLRLTGDAAHLRFSPPELLPG